MLGNYYQATTCEQKCDSNIIKACMCVVDYNNLH